MLKQMKADTCASKMLYRTWTWGQKLFRSSWILDSKKELTVKKNNVQLSVLIKWPDTLHIQVLPNVLKVKAKTVKTLKRTLLLNIDSLVYRIRTEVNWIFPTQIQCMRNLNILRNINKGKGNYVQSSWEPFDDWGKDKGKFHPRTGYEVPEGDWRYNPTLSLTSALVVGMWSTPRPDRFTPGKEFRFPLYRRPGGSQGRPGSVRKIWPPLPGFDPRPYTDYTIPATLWRGTWDN